jgi:hypothetical protein
MISYNQHLDTMDIRGHDLTNTKKFRDIARYGRAALVADDLASTKPRAGRALVRRHPPADSRHRPGARRSGTTAVRHVSDHDGKPGRARLLTLGDLDARCSERLREGNVVSMTQTLGNIFGSKVMPEGTGIWLKLDHLLVLRARGQPARRLPRSVAEDKLPHPQLCSHPHLHQNDPNFDDQRIVMATQALAITAVRRIEKGAMS